MGGTRAGSGEKQPRSPRARRRRRPELRTRAAHVALWVLVIAGAAGGITGSARPTPAPVAADVVVPASPVSPSGVAEGFVSAFLQAGQDREDLLAAYLADPPNLTRVEPGSMLATRVATLTATETEPGAWTIAVAADVMTANPDGGGYTATGTRCYLTAVRAVDTGWAVMGLPAQIACPTPARTPRLDYSGTTGLSGSDLVGDTVSRFLAALLAGTGELSRYLQPGSDIEAITPAPFTAVELTDLQLSGTSPDITPDTPPTEDAVTIEVLTSVEGTDDAGRTQRLAYVLELSSRGGRWEVVALTANPAVK